MAFTLRKPTTCPICREHMATGDTACWHHVSVNKHKPISGRGYTIERVVPGHVAPCPAHTIARFIEEWDREQKSNFDTVVAALPDVMTQEKCEAYLAHISTERARKISDLEKTGWK